MWSHNQFQSSRHYSSSSPAVAVMAEAGTTDSTDHTAAEHNQVGCRLPAVEHCKPQPYPQTLPDTCPNDMTAYTHPLNRLLTYLYITHPITQVLHRCSRRSRNTNSWYTRLRILKNKSTLRVDQLLKCS
nr:hypothetical protein [Tanacetum cinerariifolium]